ncbi:NnrU family protein [Piscinibacter sakaiensis]|uniref:NnrU family protein n=1 Tax=Piscinibacter sakaiensis TaxID=1547922 RepID=UPI003AB0A038
MAVLLAGLVLFLGLHSVSIVAPQWRDARVRQFGELRWKGLYSLIAAVGLLLIIVGYGLARQSPITLYTPPAMLRHLAWLLMAPVFVLLFAAYLPGRIQSATRHPMLLAVKLWATAHLLANGSVADVLLFGGFLAWAVADRISMKRRPARPKPELPVGRFNDAIAVVGGLVVYLLFFAVGHAWLIGVAPR